MNKLQTLACSCTIAALTFSLTACGTTEATTKPQETPQHETSQQTEPQAPVNVAELATTISSERQELLDQTAGFGQTVRDLIYPNGMFTSVTLQQSDQALDDLIKQAMASSANDEKIQSNLTDAWQTWKRLLDRTLTEQSSNRFTTTLQGLQPYFMHMNSNPTLPEACQQANSWNDTTLPDMHEQPDNPLANWQTVSTMTQQLQDDWSACMQALGSDAPAVLGEPDA